MNWKTALCVFACFFGVLVGPGYSKDAAAHAVFSANFSVTKTTDTNDGVCDADCSLREAIDAANNAAGVDVVILPPGIYNLSLGSQLNILFAFGSDVTISNSSIINNTASGANGGGITTGSTATISNTTISGNTGFDGAGIQNFNNGNLTLINVTVSGNNSTRFGGGIDNSAVVNFQNTIVAENSSPFSPDCSGTLISQGNNLLGDSTNCTITGNTSSNILDANPKVAPLANNGGPTPTHALLATSPAIDAGANCSITDQRGAVREGAACDIGAVEFACKVWNRGNSPAAFIDDIAADRSNPLVVYVAAGVGGAGILKTTDGGLTWNPANNGLSGLLVRSLAVDPNNSSVVYAGEQGGDLLAKSTDGGNSWNPSRTGINGHVFDLVINPKDTSIVYAALDALGVLKSTDAGATWVSFSSGLSGEQLILAIDPVTPSTLYTNGLAGVLKTTDGGTTWLAANNGLTDLQVTAIALDPTNPSILYVGTASGVFKSTDHGGSWTASNSGLNGAQVFSLAVDPNSGIVYTGTNTFGVFKSNDGGATWLPFNAGIVGISPSSPGFRIGSMAVGFDGVPYAGTLEGVLSFRRPALYCDEFEDGDADDWAFNKGNWSVVSGDLIAGVTKKADDISPFPGCSNCTIETDIRFDSPHATASLLGWVADKKNLVELLLRQDKGIIILKQKANGPTVAKGKIRQVLEVNHTYHVRLNFDGAGFHAALDGVPILDLPTAVAPNGGVGYRAKSTDATAAAVSFREIVVH